MANPAVADIMSGKPLTTGGIYRGAPGATLPTEAVAGPYTGFTGLGYVSDDGLSETVDRSTDKIKAWGGDVVKVVQTEFSVTYEFTLYQALNADVLAAVYGSDNVETTAATATAGTRTAVKVNSESLEHAPWIFAMKDGPARILIVVPDGQISEVGEVKYDDGSVIGYPVTLEAFKDAEGNQAYKYLDNGVIAA